jgi:septal ring-binding cell division protein DamX
VSLAAAAAATVAAAAAAPTAAVSGAGVFDAAVVELNMYSVSKGLQLCACSISHVEGATTVILIST